MRPGGGAGIVEIGIENIFAMWPSWLAIGNPGLALELLSLAVIIKIIRYEN